MTSNSTIASAHPKQAYVNAVTGSFAMPDTCARVQAMLKDNTSRFEDLADVIAVDPSVASKLLKLANSALFKFPSQITTLDKAVNVLGGEATYNLVMTETATSAFKHFESDGIDIDRFWRQSIFAALLGKNLAKMARIRGSEQFYLIGLMHNIGELAVLHQSPGLAAKCERDVTVALPWERQQQILGFTYADIGGEILDTWQLPSQICDGVRFQHDENRAFTHKPVGLSYIVARSALAILDKKQFEYQTLIQEDLLTFVGLTWDDLIDGMNFTRMEAHKVLHIMDPSRY